MIFFLSAGVYAAERPDALDTGFGTNGIVTTNISADDIASDVAIQTDGKIVVAGAANVYSDTPVFFVCRYTSDGANTMVLARYTSSGVLDTTFDVDGVANTDAAASAAAVAIQSDGKFLLVGYKKEAVYYEDSVVARFKANGGLDSLFATGGILDDVISEDNDSFNGVALQADGKIIVVGAADTGTDWDIKIIRLHGGDALNLEGARMLLLSE